MLSLRSGIFRLSALAGVDRAVAYTISGRVSTIFGNIGTVALMLRFLSPIEQGYYFTLLVLVALQVVFELGFSFVILQLAAHERAHLVVLPDGRLSGDATTHARLASILQLGVRWYGRAAVAVGLVLLPTGTYFFSRGTPTTPEVHWFLPWLTAVLACVYLFLQIPFCTFLEGCGEIRQVAGLRLCQAAANAVLAWICMLTRHGLFAPGMMMVASGVAGSFFLGRRRVFLLELLRYPVAGQAVSWHREIWPFQWRIGLSWLCASFALQLFTPMLFHYRSAVEAGRMGISISAVGYVSAIALAWITTKAPIFAQFVARREFDALDALFFRTFRQAGSFLALMVAGCMAGVVLLGRLSPALAGRLLAPRDFACLLLGTVGGVLAQSMAIYLRSFKREPLLWQSIAVAALTLSLSRASVRTYGTTGIVLSYMICAGIVSPASATLLFRSWRRAVARAGKPTPVAAEASDDRAQDPAAKPQSPQRLRLEAGISYGDKGQADWMGQ